MLVVSCRKGVSDRGRDVRNEQDNMVRIEEHTVVGFLQRTGADECRS